MDEHSMAPSIFSIFKQYEWIIVSSRDGDIQMYFMKGSSDGSNKSSVCSVSNQSPGVQAHQLETVELSKRFGIAQHTILSFDPMQATISLRCACQILVICSNPFMPHLVERKYFNICLKIVLFNFMRYFFCVWQYRCGLESISVNFGLT